jgi:hypothetical protein
MRGTKPTPVAGGRSSSAARAGGIGVAAASAAPGVGSLTMTPGALQLQEAAARVPRRTPAAIGKGRRRRRRSPPASRSRTKSATFAEKHAAMVGHTLEALRKSGDEHPFARVQHDHAHVNGTVKRI